MLSLAETRRILGDANKSDTEIEEIRDSFRILAEIIFEQWTSEIKKQQL